MSFEGIVDYLAFLSNEMENIVSEGYFHFKEDLISFNFTGPFHGFGIIELDGGDFLFLFVEENKLVSFFVILDILNDELFKFYF